MLVAVFTWLRCPEGIRIHQYRVFTVGNLSQDDIKGYVYGADGYPGMVNATRWGKDKGFTLPESLWEAAYKRLGGNVGAWRPTILSAARRFKPASDEEQTKVNLEQAWQQGRTLAPCTEGAFCQGVGACKGLALQGLAAGHLACYLAQWVLRHSCWLVIQCRSARLLVRGSGCLVDDISQHERSSRANMGSGG